MANQPNDPNALLPNQDRKDLIQQGIDYLELWLADLIRVGVLQYDFSPDSMKEISSRMVDAKLAGAARRLRKLATLERSNQFWLEELLSELTYLYLLVRSFKKVEELPRNLQHALYSVSGFSIPRQKLVTSEGIQDQWGVMGLKYEQEENLRARYCWVMGLHSKRSALLLDFAFGRSSFESSIKFTQSYLAKLVYYPSSFPMRGFLIDPVAKPKLNSFPGTFTHFGKFLDVYAYGISKNPFLSSLPVAIRDVKINVSESSFQLIDVENKMIPIANSKEKLWPLFASQGNEAISVFGIWYGDKIELLSASIKGDHFLL